MKEVHVINKCISIVFIVMLFGFFSNGLISATNTFGTSSIPYVDIILIQSNADINSDYGTGLTRINCGLRYSFPVEYLENDTCLIYLKCDLQIEEIEVSITPSIIRIEDLNLSRYDCDVFGWINFNITFYKDQTDHYLSTSLDGAFTVYGTWELESGPHCGNVEPSTGTLNFPSICEFDVYYPEDENQYSGPIGKWKTIPIRIVNRGNSEVMIRITPSLNFYLNSDLDISLEYHSINISEGEEVIFNLKIRQNEGGGKTNKINLDFEGEVDDSTDIRSIDVPYQTHHTIGSFVDYFVDSYCTSIIIIILWISFCALLVDQVRRRNKKQKDRKQGMKKRTIILISIGLIICIWIAGLAFIYCRVSG